MGASPSFVFIHDGELNQLVSPSNLTKGKLCIFSDYAARVLAYHPETEAQTRYRFNKSSLTLPRGFAEVKAGIKICKWIADNQPNEPTTMTMKALGLETFDECVYVYQTAHCMKLKRELRGDDVRDAISEYMHQGCLRFDEFVMIHEVLGFDSGLSKAAKHTVIFGKVKGGVACPPEMDKIEAYAKEVGIWKEMLMIEDEIKKKMAEQRVIDQKQAASSTKKGVK